MRLDEGNDAVVGMIVVNDPEKETVMVVSEQGYEMCIRDSFTPLPPRLVTR